jgi:hypothetical protein
MPGRVEREVVASLLRWYPQKRTISDIAAEVYYVLRKTDAPPTRQRKRDLTPKYLVVREALLRLEQKGEAVRSPSPPRKEGVAQRAYWGADGWTLKEREKTERRQKQAQLGLRVV